MKKVLIIEDDSTIRENTAEILRLANFEIVTAANGREGRVLAKEAHPDLIICDIMMPLLDGYGVLYVLSKDPDTANIPFIFLTAKTEKSEMRKGMELGADDYLCKPFDDTELLTAVEVRLRKYDLLKKKIGEDKNISGNFQNSSAAAASELEHLSMKRPFNHYKKREIIFHAGDNPQYVFFIKKGVVKTYKTHDDGKEYITSMHKDGEFFGHPALFSDKPYYDSAVVLQDSEICKIPKDEFLELNYTNKWVANKFIKMLSGDIENQEMQLVRLAYDSVRKRTAEALLVLQKRYSIEDKDGRALIVVNRDDLAGLVGTAPETVIRCLSEFKEDKMIATEGRKIFILDEKGLKNI